MVKGINGVKVNSGISNGINGANSNVSYKLNGGIFTAVQKLHELPEFKDVTLRDIEFALADSNGLTIRIIDERDHIFDSSGKEIQKGATVNIDLSTIAAHLKGKKLSDNEIAKLDKKDKAASMALQASGQNSPFDDYKDAINVFKEIKEVEPAAETPAVQPKTSTAAMPLATSAPEIETQEAAPAVPTAANEFQTSNNPGRQFAQGRLSNNPCMDFLQMLLMLNFVSCFLESMQPQPFLAQNPYNSGNMGFGFASPAFSPPRQGYFPMNFLT